VLQRAAQAIGHTPIHDQISVRSLKIGDRNRSNSLSRGSHEQSRDVSERSSMSEGQELHMDPMEIQARATIAAALIMSRAVEVPTIPASVEWSKDVKWWQDTAALRLRDLTDYIYQTITTARTR
jgi:hypothetical protein